MSTLAANRLKLKPCVERRLRILIVEDSTYNIFVLKELLKSITERTLDVETALNG